MGLTGLDALGLVVRLGAGVALLHLQQQATSSVLPGPAPAASPSGAQRWAWEPAGRLLCSAAAIFW